MMLGAALGAVVRLSADDEVTLGIGICEGIEDGLAILNSGWQPVWACLSTSGITAFPLLDGIEALTIFCDRDGPGFAAARKPQERGERQAVTSALCRRQSARTSRRRPMAKRLLNNALAAADAASAKTNGAGLQPRFRFERWCDITYDPAQANWLLHKMLPTEGVAVLYGKWKQFKSFVALYLGVAVARGEPWAGRKTKKGIVVYIAGEGGHGLTKRIEVYKQQARPHQHRLLSRQGEPEPRHPAG